MTRSRPLRCTLGLLALAVSLFAVGAAFHGHKSLSPRPDALSIGLPSGSPGDAGPCLICRVSQLQAIASGPPPDAGPAPLAPESCATNGVVLPHATGLSPASPRAPPAADHDA